MTRLRVASLNMSGAQDRGAWAHFLHACAQWVKRDKVHMIMGQEHNLDPARESECRRMAERRGFALVIAFAEAGPDGVHHGGTLILIATDAVEWPETDAKRAERTVHSEAGAVVVRIGWHGRDMVLGSVYAPATPVKRIDFFNRARKWITKEMYLGGDWNCVPDVTLDVQSSDPLRYKNYGGMLLEDVTSSKGLIDFRRAQLEESHEATRIPLGTVRTKQGPDVVCSRLDRWYIPTSEAHEDLLPTLSVRWDILWSAEARDHATIVLDLDDAQGEAGHQRHTIREDIVSEPRIQTELIKLTNAAYDKGGSERKKWERAHKAMRHFLLNETAARRVKEKKKIKELKGMLYMLHMRVRKHGATEATLKQRKNLTAELYETEHPETKGEESLKRQVASAQLSDTSTKRFFANYKASAKQQWINKIGKATWIDGKEPVFQGETTSPKEVPNELANFWKMIFGEKVIDQAAAEDLLEGRKGEDGVRRGGMCERRLLQPSIDMMDAEITDKEVESVMQSLPLGKSAGPDRIPNAVYKYMPVYFSKKLGAMLRESVAHGALPSSFMEGDISLLYKKESREDPRNYRPITLLQNAYKIFTRVLAKRMKKVVHEFVSECQKGFTPHAFIAECSMLTNLIEAYMNDDDHPERGAMILFLDMEKAFDRVSYEFLLKAAEAVGFGPRFLKTIGMMYNVDNAPRRRIYANGYYSDWFDIKSGVAQGCPLSPLLFLLVAQALKVATDDAQNPEFRGISIGNRRIKVSQFADDTELFLRGPSDLRAAQGSLSKWCGATGMRENFKKREGIAMGKFRNSKSLPKGVKWVKDGEWIISLGSPVGNRMDHDAWWKKKIQAVQGKAQRWLGLFQASYFGRNLIVQSKYLGSLRYWLYSIPMGRLIRDEVKGDADTMWWSKEPDLTKPKKRIRRFVAKRTAIGSRGKGGLNNMDWDSHVTAILSEWVLRWAKPPDRDVCAWKHVMHHMIMVDKKGIEKFSEGSGIMFCKMTPADKVRLMRGIPKNAEYLKSCLRAFWKLGLKQDTKHTSNIRCESFWHNARFELKATPKERKYFSTIVDVQSLGDVIDSSTLKPRTLENWASWIRNLQENFDEEAPDENFVDEMARRITELTSKIPDARQYCKRYRIRQPHSTTARSMVRL